jgi:hypothetical protein
MKSALSRITGIDVDVLDNSNLLSGIPVGRRMSWASKRLTSRPEDMAYCLFGIFDVNLPLIYGEGSKAFKRLQEAIAQETNDLSLFAWTSELDTARPQKYRGLFAVSPSEFERCDTLERIDNTVDTPTNPFVLTNKGVQMTARLSPAKRSEDSGGQDDGEEKYYLMGLQCVSSSEEDYDDQIYDDQMYDEQITIYIRLVKTPDGFVRHQSHIPIRILSSRAEASKSLSIFIRKTVTPVESETLDKQLSCRFVLRFKNTTEFKCEISQAIPDHLWDDHDQCFIAAGHGLFTGIITLKTSGGTIEVRKNMGSRTFELSWPDSFVVVGMEPAGAMGMLPIVGLFQITRAPDICRLLDQQQTHGLGYVIGQVRSLLRNRLSSGEHKLPVRLTMNPYYLVSNSSFPTLVSGKPLKISLKTKQTIVGGLTSHIVDIHVDSLAKVAK